MLIYQDCIIYNTHKTKMDLIASSLLLFPRNGGKFLSSLGCGSSSSASCMKYPDHSTSLFRFILQISDWVQPFLAIVPFICTLLLHIHIVLIIQFIWYLYAWKSWKSHIIKVLDQRGTTSWERPIWAILEVCVSSQSCFHYNTCARFTPRCLCWCTSGQITLCPVLSFWFPSGEISYWD